MGGVSSVKNQGIRVFYYKQKLIGEDQMSGMGRPCVIFGMWVQYQMTCGRDIYSYSYLGYLRTYQIRVQDRIMEVFYNKLLVSSLIFSLFLFLVYIRLVAHLIFLTIIGETSNPNVDSWICLLFNL